MKVRVVYSSRTGNTRKVANAIAEAVGCSAQPVDGCTITEPVDLLFVGGAIYATHDHDFPPEVKRFVGSLHKKLVKKAVVFGTYAFANDAIGMLTRLLQKAGIPVAEKSFTCKGKFLFFNLGRPSAADLEKAKEFAKGF